MGAGRARTRAEPGVWEELARPAARLLAAELAALAILLDYVRATLGQLPDGCRRHGGR